MKRFALMFAMAALAATLAFAQQPAPKPAPEGGAKPSDKAPAALPTVDEVLAKYVKAMGGEAAIKKVTSRVTKGTFEMPAMNLTGTMESLAKAPNLSYQKIEIGGFGSVVQVCDGKTCWSQDPMSGLRELTGAELVNMKIRSDFHFDLKMKELFKSLTVKSREKLAGGSAVVIEAVPSEGAPQKYYFDEATGLLARLDAEQEGPQGKMLTESTFEDYKVVDGVNTAHTLKITNPAFSMTMKIEEVKSNAAIDDAKFGKPSAQ